jgi:hypothetical protein
VNYLPRLALNLDPPDLCLIYTRVAGVNHQRLALNFLNYRHVLYLQSKWVEILGTGDVAQ